MFSRLITELLEWDCEIALIGIFKVLPHAIVQISWLFALVLAVLSNKLKCFAHAILSDFLFCFPQLFEFTRQYLKSPLHRVVAL
jgi:uncharacterized membrane protein